ncbi:hypothetical protein INN71_07000 [Nocardioides sp. ChNu-153]|uniref:hypothetical protein n=1 Tax=unclassified Nocardioides TaxID=2615069 RepID=UPI0024060C4B|nr:MULTISPECIES: hypothetical protein [unclassified Nocardioides]MDF9716714.1 hypothetical protein [Nocardioides sp. ChNu-99]MDN7121137.1 hypothetical protein [Nocardioides sp. ChNu-153]
MSTTTAPRAVGDLRWEQRRRRWTRWSGRSWVPAVYARDPAALRRSERPDAGPSLEPSRREALLRQAVSEEVLAGAVVRERDHLWAVLGYPGRVSHGWHAVLTLLTAGLWAIVWLASTLSTPAERRVRLEIDPWGNVWAVETPRGRKRT